MTEKDSLEEVKETPQEEVEAEEKEQAPDTEKESDFLVQWKERHQAYLASQKDASADEKSENQSALEHKPKAVEPKRKGRALVKEQSDTADSDKKSPKAAPKKNKAPLPRKALLKAFPIIAAALVGLLLAIYFISPLSKKKQIEVVGNHYLSSEMIRSYSQISEKDYALTTLLLRKNIEQAIKNSSTLVKSDKLTYQFPNRFTIQVEEYAEVGYVKDKDHYRLVLSSGNISETALSAEELPERHTLINLADKRKVEELALQLASIDPSIIEMIQSIELTPSKVSADLLTMTMHDENTLLIPLSEIDIKLPYYPKIAKQLSLPSVVDMEVGAFSYAK
ncbi:FtsQ-type POTRA domain-containing protein [Streptococcus sp. zg-86]|uniref:Cell division protein DivIB n=1 Tax=Streptococcus zhangguiae TaxID=2664091 RepID=A0A6I4R9Z3_9STRE|nr:MULTISPECIES: FtsQ-type POTRA domain-containing protein [unclassified Streptococcus]MTB64386.1 FtsQ-type POTRA domain-containing protein [Streptococcus sp. zg-86]MTB90696.1 FtsQ-type POTRA domain-containing protein [Streptococcus sp. zg-36]MWV56309.1 FtsQ-type POTRA domain-containing protein [Streptococcus sp. zg-70]QTH47475.1 FtsQ-type POTRA domain-containing protein [Streptococcus sp. zg-86]